MTASQPAGLSRRERQVMDFLYRHDRATAAELTAGLPDPPSNSAVRALLRSLEEKGHVAHTEDGRAYVYRPIVLGVCDVSLLDRKSTRLNSSHLVISYAV